MDFRRSIVAILKHTNPCGVGQDDEIERAAESVRDGPPGSFGGVIVCNRPLTESLARVISEIFTDVIIAPDLSRRRGRSCKRRRILG